MIPYMQTESERRGESEWCVCGSILCSSDAIDEITAVIGTEMIFDRRCQHLVEVAIAAHRQGKPTTYDILWHDLNREIVTADDLAKMMEAVPHAAHAAYYAKTVRECWLIRELAAKVVDSHAKIAETGSVVEDVLMELVSGIERLQCYSVAGDEIVSFGEVLERLPREQEEQDTGRIPTGISTLDMLIKHGGWAPGQLIVVGARPGGGKSSLLTTFGLAAVRNGYPATVLSYEMTPDEIGERIEVQGSFSRHDEVSRMMAMELPFKLCNSGAWNIDKVEAEIRRQVAKNGIKLVLLDYIGLIPMRPRERVEKHIHVGNVTRILKQLAMRLQITIIAAQQLNRAVESRASKAPLMSDFRDSGSVEQDADILIGIESKDAAEEGQFNADVMKSILHVMKQRNGPRGNVTVEYAASSFLFRDMNIQTPSW